MIKGGISVEQPMYYLQCVIFRYIPMEISAISEISMTSVA